MLSITAEVSAPNVLAFSCEAANAMIECSQNAARLRLLQRRVRPSPSYERERPRKPRVLRSPTSLPRIAQARGAQPEESIVISLPSLRAPRTSAGAWRTT